MTLLDIVYTILDVSFLLQSYLAIEPDIRRYFSKAEDTKDEMHGKVKAGKG